MILLSDALPAARTKNRFGMITVATSMQREIKKSQINQVNKLEWSAHIDPKWPAKALLWLASYSGNEYLGKEVNLRDATIRQKIGMK